MASRELRYWPPKIRRLSTKISLRMLQEWAFWRIAISRIEDIDAGIERVFIHFLWIKIQSSYLLTVVFLFCHIVWRSLSLPNDWYLNRNLSKDISRKMHVWSFADVSTDGFNRTMPERRDVSFTQPPARATEVLVPTPQGRRPVSSKRPIACQLAEFCCLCTNQISMATLASKEMYISLYV